MQYRGEPIDWSNGTHSGLFTSTAALQCVQGLTDGMLQVNKRGVMTGIRCVPTDQNCDLKNVLT